MSTNCRPLKSIISDLFRPMSKIARLLYVALIMGPLFGACRDNAKAATETGQPVPLPPKKEKVADKPAAVPAVEIPLGAQALIDAYPNIISGYKDGKVIFKDGTEMVYDDGRKKDFAYMLDNSDLEDMFYVPYRRPNGAPGYQEDAGRSRNEALFKKMYGNSAAAVQRTLVSVPWFGQTVKFTNVNGAADQLKKVRDELAQHPELQKYLKSSGTFYWRPVRGANRLSAHSYGIAFDIGVAFSDYWLWKNKGANEDSKIKYANHIPQAIVDIFEKHGFIWGGSWYHFDTMHFEYRPEILRYAELVKEQQKD